MHEHKIDKKKILFWFGLIFLAIAFYAAGGFLVSFIFKLLFLEGLAVFILTTILVTTLILVFETI